MTKKLLLLSDLFNIGVKYIHIDGSTSHVLFNDGTEISYRYWSETNDSGTTFDDLEFSCSKGKEFFDVVDDVGYMLNYRFRESVLYKSKSVLIHCSGDKELEDVKKLY